MGFIQNDGVDDRNGCVNRLYSGANGWK